ncbi:hypothetical protein AKJ09_01967 [Labilithrix luteola]|uniref:Uncharacterized protein n=1 Tax=Labilithrix luteola TaxID=1391654 RepID=A0A0K1PP58_9BACT|nr:hypothetical protein [Labilithrix luteola]AKU95303.1 hypothetical protein AKJ09_01967 [Labilithrix luteola]
MNDVSARRTAFDNERASTRAAALRAVGRAQATLGATYERWGAVPESHEEVALPTPDAWRDLLFGAALARAAGETDAAAALERYAGAQPVDPEVVPEGSVLDAARRGELDRFETEWGSGRVRLVAFRYWRLSADARAIAPHAGVLIAHRQRAGVDDYWCYESTSLRSEDAWPFDVEAARAALVASADEEYGEVNRHLSAGMLRRALRTRPTSFGVWVLRDWQDLVGDGPLFAFDVDGEPCSLRLAGESVVEPSGRVKVPLVLVVGTEEREQEVFFDRLEGEDFLREAPVDEAAQNTVRAALDAWRGDLERRARSAALSDCMPHDLLTVKPLTVVRRWLDEGPPPARPVRVSWNEHTITQLLPTFRSDHRIEEDEDGLTVNVVDLHIGRHTMRFRIVLDVGTRIELASFDGDFVPMTGQDSQAAPGLVFAPVGDAIAFRDVCAALSSLIVRASTDVLLAPSGAEEEDEEEDVEDGEEDENDDHEDTAPRRLTDVLRFADGDEAWGLGAPSFDWRIETDFAISESPDEIALRLRDDPAGRAAWMEACERYTAFIVETLDPSFTPPRIPW